MSVVQLTRLFRFGSTTLDDVDPSLTPEQVLSSYSGSFPFLAHATLGEPIVEGDTLVYPVLKKEVQTKGAAGKAHAAKSASTKKPSRSTRKKKTAGKSAPARAKRAGAGATRAAKPRATTTTGPGASGRVVTADSAPRTARKLSRPSIANANSAVQALRQWQQTTNASVPKLPASWVAVHDRLQLVLRRPASPITDAMSVAML